jgi:hypothetical protein
VVAAYRLKPSPMPVWENNRRRAVAEIAAVAH